MSIHARGALFLVGGAADTVYADFARLAGGAKSHVVVITHASEIPQQRGDEISAALRAHGVKRITVLLPDSTPNLPRNTTAVFIGGGAQDRLLAALEANGLAQQLRDANRRGVLIAGTSAGAAGSVATMIAGNTAAWSPRSRKLGGVLLGTGLFLRRDIVVDTHFAQRRRQSRLRIVVGMLSDIVGLGLDEDTAALVEGNEVRVFGAGRVWKYTAHGGTTFHSIAASAKEETYLHGEMFSL